MFVIGRIVAGMKRHQPFSQLSLVALVPVRHSLRAHPWLGYAAGPIIRVEVSADDGETWLDAEILGEDNDEDEDEDERSGGKKWAWVLWRGWVNVQKSQERTILSRAWDSKRNGQPRFSRWNLRGVGYNGYGEVGG